MHNESTLAQPSSRARRDTPYDTGQLVLAYLDVRIREATIGTHSLEDVFRKLIQPRNRSLTIEAFEAGVAAIVGDHRLDDEIDTYATTSTVPLVEDTDWHRLREAPLDNSYTPMQTPTPSPRLTATAIPDRSPSSDTTDPPGATTTSRVPPPGVDVPCGPTRAGGLAALVVAIIFVRRLT